MSSKNVMTITTTEKLWPLFYNYKQLDVKLVTSLYVDKNKTKRNFNDSSHTDWQETKMTSRDGKVTRVDAISKCRLFYITVWFARSPRVVGAAGPFQSFQLSDNVSSVRDPPRVNGALRAGHMRCSQTACETPKRGRTRGERLHSRFITRNIKRARGVIDRASPQLCLPRSGRTMFLPPIAHHVILINRESRSDVASPRRSGYVEGSTRGEEDREKKACKARRNREIVLFIRRRRVFAPKNRPTEHKRKCTLRDST